MAKGKSSKLFDSSGEDKRKLSSSVGEEESIAYNKQNIELQRKEIKELQRKISLNKKSASLKKAEQSQLEKQLQTVGKLSDEEYARYDANDKFLKQLESEEKILQNTQQNLSRLKKIEAERFSNFEKLLSVNEELDDINTSIASKFGEQSKLAEKIGIITDQTLKTHKVSASIIDSMKDPNEKKRAIELNEAFKQRTTSIASASNEFAKQKISQEEYNNIIISSQEAWEDILSKMKLTSPEAKALVEIMKSADTATNKFYKSAEKSQEVLESMDRVMGEFSGIPGMNELGNVIKNINGKAAILKVSLFALGAVAGKALYDYFGALDKIQRIAPFKQRIAQIEAEIQIREKGVESEMVAGKFRVDQAQELASAEETIFKARVDASNASRRAALEFNAQIQQSALQFRVASKTALFGDKLGGVAYGAAQMEMAGVSADRVAQSMKATGNIMGKMPTSEMASNMAVMATRTGATDESLASLTRMFTDIDGLSMSTALNMEDGLAAMASSLNIPMDAFINEMADASKEMLGYQIKSGPALAKQVAYAKSLGVSFSDIAKAGQNMVLNYKDSIKSEMQLSAMLGKQVDLSEVRSKFAMGDTKGALEALKAQGLNPAEMDMFQQQALQQATGMDLQTLRNIYSGEGKTTDLKTGNADTNNRQFLGRVQAAQSEQAIGSANISAQQAIFSADLEKKITEEYFNKIINPITAADKKLSADAAALEKQKIQAEIASIERERDLKLAKLGDEQLQGFEAQLVKANTELDYFQNVLTGVSRLLGGAALMGLGSVFMKGKGGNLLKNMMPSFGKSAVQPTVKTATKEAPFVTKSGKTLYRATATATPPIPATPAPFVTESGKTLYRATATATPPIPATPAPFVPQSGMMGKLKSFFSKTTASNVPTQNITSVSSKFPKIASITNALGKTGKMLGKTGKILGPLGVIASAGLDYSSRKEGGQTTTQAAAGAGGAVAGGIAGAKGGASAGAAIGALFGGVGAVPGAFIGGILGGIGGSLAGSAIADYFTGAGKKSSKPTVTPEDEKKSTVTTISSDSNAILNTIQKNDHTRGISMYKEMQNQNSQLKVANVQSTKILDRTHKTADQLLVLNNTRMLELININKNIQALQEANVELIVQLVKHAQMPTDVTIDGKLVGRKLGDIYQSSRTVTL